MQTFGDAFGGGFSGDADAEDVKEYFVRFLNNYRENDTDMNPYYYEQLEKMIALNSTALVVDMHHLINYDFALADVVETKYLQMENYLRKGVQNFVQQHAPDYVKREEVEKEFYITLWGLDHVERFRDLKTAKLGKLVAFSGTVTRSTEVRPELYLGTFRCNTCSTLARNVEQQFKFTYPVICTNATCGNRTNWSLVRDESHFVDWQRLRVQENTDEVPAGSLPRTMDVVLRGHNVEKAKPGDKLVFTGAFIVVPDVSVMGAPGERAVVKPSGPAGGNAGDGGFTGPKQLGSRELTYRTAFLASAVQSSDARTGMVNIRSEDHMTPDEVLASYEEPAREQVLRMRDDPDIWHNITRSLAPGVYGHDQVKQAILLMLFGGVHKTTKDGSNLRGDINVAIIGDPACAKSQLLKYVAGFLPRAVYTSGKSSTAAGLTASVVKDSDTGEFCIEAGALMLADNGICCIDEFDKMDVKDQVAIHEAMEQQTISISKAGINATLNARASILAAANPIGGRYDKSRPLKQNIALPPAILSRFDLVHVMLDETTEATDARIAAHIIGVHRLREQAFDVAYSTEAMQRYIRYARSIIPRLTPDAKTALVAAYRDLRSEDAAPGTQSSYRITVRQLEALVRLSEALARVHCRTHILPSYVTEAQRLLRASVLRVEQADVELETPEDPLAGVNHPGNDPAPEPDEVEEDGVGGDENAGDTANQQHTAEAMDVDGADDAARKSKAARTAAPAAPAAAEPRQKTKVDARKFQYIKGMLVRRLKEREAELELQMAAEAERRRQEREAKLGLQMGTEAELEEEEEDAAAESQVAIMGLRQVELVEGYLNHEVKRSALVSEKAVAEEFQLVERVIAHLVRHENLLIVVHRPERNEGEDNTEYLKRLLNDRVLALHANHDPTL